MLAGRPMHLWLSTCEATKSARVRSFAGSRRKAVRSRPAPRAFGLRIARNASPGKRLRAAERAWQVCVLAAPMKLGEKRRLAPEQLTRLDKGRWTGLAVSAEEAVGTLRGLASGSVIRLELAWLRVVFYTVLAQHRMGDERHECLLGSGNVSDERCSAHYFSHMCVCVCV